MEQIYLNLIPGGVSPVCYVSQYDVGRKIRLHLREGSDPYVLSGAETITATIRKSSGEALIYDIANTSASYVDLVVNYDATDVIGESVCELVIYNSGVKLGSANFKMRIDPDVYSGDERLEIRTASGDPATFETNIVDNIPELKCNINAVQNGTPWIDSNIIDKEPYLFRKTAGTASRFGNGIYDQLIGGSFAFNQNVINANKSFEGTITTTNSYYLFGGMAYPIIENHVYMGHVDDLTNISTISPYLQTGYFYKNFLNGFAVLKANTAYGNGGWIGYHSNDESTPLGTFNCKFDNFFVVDLTQAFGTAIADYVYNLETATAGAGIAWLKKYGFFTKPYYEYNAGGLKHVSASAHIIRGFNQWDEETRNGYYGLDGNFYSNADYIASKNMISVIPSEYYYLKCGSGNYFGRFVWYDANKNFIDTSVNTGNIEIQIPANAYYMNFDMKADYGSTYNHDICINFSNSSLNGTYKPYTQQLNPLADVVLRGIPQIDANGNLSYYGDVYSSNGNVERKMGTFNDLSSLYWIMGNRNDSNTGYIFYSPQYDLKRNGGCIASKQFINHIEEVGLWETLELNEIYLATDYIVLCSSQSSVAGLESEIANINLVYSKEESTTETAQPFNNPQMIDANGSEEYVDGNVYESIDLSSLSWALNQGADWYYYASLTQTAKLNSLMLAENYEIIKVSSIGFVNNQIAVDASTIYCRTDAVGNTPTGIAIYEKSTASDVSIPVGHNTLHANICEISGWDSCKVTRNGINQWDEEWEIGRYYANTINSKNPIEVLPNKTYRMICPYGCTLYEFNSQGTATISRNLASGDTFTTRDDTITVAFFANVSYGTTYNHDISLNYPATETDYFAYEGTSRTISLGENTVYGGELNVSTGKLKITKAKKAVLSSMNFDRSTGWDENAFYIGNFFSDAVAVAGYSTIADLKCNVSSIETPAGLADGLAHGIGQGGGNNLYINLGCDLNDIESICESGFYIVYNLTEPTIIQLTAHQLEALLGTNTLAHDCNGTADVKYWYKLGGDS